MHDLNASAMGHDAGFIELRLREQERRKANLIRVEPILSSSGHRVLV